ncbi:uncharacterized protein LOC132303148 [Cornus florida]|uniref:uncharacterized protein LOC132303148 n=1 Tax=Cornus florida TaxID=4283 RepID=UPI00289D23C4|nr:uncharacterized protein LOC132303148 [Cornus florida]
MDISRLNAGSEPEIPRKLTMSTISDNTILGKSTSRSFKEYAGSESYDVKIQSLSPSPLRLGVGYMATNIGMHALKLGQITGGLNCFSELYSGGRLKALDVQGVSQRHYKGTPKKGTPKKGNPKQAMDPKSPVSFPPRPTFRCPICWLDPTPERTIKRVNLNSSGDVKKHFQGTIECKRGPKYLTHPNGSYCDWCGVGFPTQNDVTKHEAVCPQKIWEECKKAAGLN